MEEGILLVALGCGRLPGTLQIAARHPCVVFGTMDGRVLSDLIASEGGNTASAVSVYFYVTG
jgi:hypothetical protein